MQTAQTRLRAVKSNERVQEFEKGDAGSSGAIADELGCLDVAAGRSSAFSKAVEAPLCLADRKVGGLNLAEAGAPAFSYAFFVP